MIVHGIAFCRLRAAVAVVIALAASTALSQQSAPSATPGLSPRRGGLLPQRTEPGGSTLITREELIRKFDLDRNGRIDEAELEIARSRMRRERAEMQPQSIIDPLTGRPRTAGGTPSPGRESKPAAVAEDDLLLVPGRPDDRPPAATKPKPAQSSKAAAEPSKPRDLNAAVRDPATGARIAPNTLRPPVVNGGVRAGGMPVRPGYGSGLPKGDLNAGRPLPNGFQPYGRMPPQPPAAAAGRMPPQQRPNLFPDAGPRVSAEDIGQ